MTREISKARMVFGSALIVATSLLAACGPTPVTQTTTTTERTVTAPVDMPPAAVSTTTTTTEHKVQP